MVYNVRHFGACTELAGLSLRSKDGDLRARQIIKNDLRHIFQRPARMMFEDKQTVIRTDALHF